MRRAEKEREGPYYRYMDHKDDYQPYRLSQHELRNLLQDEMED